MTPQLRVKSVHDSNLSSMAPPPPLYTRKELFDILLQACRSSNRDTSLRTVFENLVPERNHDRIMRQDLIKHLAKFYWNGQDILRFIDEAKSMQLIRD